MSATTEVTTPIALAAAIARVRRHERRRLRSLRMPARGSDAAREYGRFYLVDDMRNQACETFHDIMALEAYCQEQGIIGNHECIVKEAD